MDVEGTRDACLLLQQQRLHPELTSSSRCKDKGGFWM